MFDHLRSAFREAVKNFKDELGRDEVPEAVDRLLVGMKNEVTEAKTRLHDLEQAIEQAAAEIAREGSEAETCVRRETMARRIGDEETARIAGEFAAKHQHRHDVLEEKKAALEKELELRRAEIEEMLDQVREAQRRRDLLAAEVGRTQARESLRGGDDLFGELDRMAEKMGDRERTQSASEFLDDLEERVGSDHGSAPPPPSVDDRLADLKRRMGQD